MFYIFINQLRTLLPIELRPSTCSSSLICAYVVNGDFQGSPCGVCWN